MAIVRTFGPGGDFPGLYEIFNNLILATKLNDNEVWNCTGDHNVTLWPGTGITGTTYNPDGKALTINGNGFTITTTNIVLLFNPYNGNGFLTIENMVLSPSHATSNSVSLHLNKQGNLYNIPKKIESVRIFSRTLGNGGFHLDARYLDTDCKIINCSAYGCYIGFFCAGSVLPEAERAAIENCFAWDCSIGYNVDLGDWYVRNCVAAHEGIGKTDWAFPVVAANKVFNSADSDDTCVVHGGVVRGVVDGDFLSTNPLDASFSKINQASKLYGTGTLDISHTSDIEGNPRPNGEGSVSIGCYEPLTIVERNYFGKFIFDAGKVYKNFQSMENPGVLLGATRGGNVFSVEPEYKNIAVDGARDGVKEGRRITRVTAKMTLNFIEISHDILQLALPGSYKTTSPYSIRRALEIALSDYLDNIVLLIEIAGSSNPLGCGLENVICDNNFEMSFQDGEESGLAVTFTGHFKPADLDLEPWFLLYPTELTALDSDNQFSNWFGPLAKMFNEVI